MESESEKQIKLIDFLVAFKLANYFCKNANNIDIIIKFDTYKINILYLFFINYLYLNIIKIPNFF